MSEAGAEDPIGIALLVAAALETAGGTYFVGGSVASSLQGDPRSTNDIDFVVSLPVGRVDAFVDALGSEFEVDRDMLRDALRRGSCSNGFYLPLVTKIDLFGVGRAPFDVSEFSRKSAVPVGATGASIVIKSPEDSVLRKLLWFREGGEVSERQWRDVVAILRVSGHSLDRAYLAEWARQLKCEELLARAELEAKP